MNCDEVQRFIESSGRAELPPEVSAHLATCDACLQRVLTDVLAAPPTVAVSPDFSGRVVVRLPARDAAQSWPRWPVIAAAALSMVILLAGLWLLLPAIGAPQHEIWAEWYWAAFLIAAGESAVLIACTWDLDHGLL